MTFCGQEVLGSCQAFTSNSAWHGPKNGWRISLKTGESLQVLDVILPDSIRFYEDQTFAAGLGPWTKLHGLRSEVRKKFNQHLPWMITWILDIPQKAKVSKCKHQLSNQLFKNHRTTINHMINHQNPSTISSIYTGHPKLNLNYLFTKE